MGPQVFLARLSVRLKQEPRDSRVWQHGWAKGKEHKDPLPNPVPIGGTEARLGRCAAFPFSKARQQRPLASAREVWRPPAALCSSRTLSLSTRRKEPRVRGNVLAEPESQTYLPFQPTPGRASATLEEKPGGWPPGAPTAHPGVPGVEPKLAQPQHLLQPGWLTCLHGPGVPRVPRRDHWGAWVLTTGF